MIDYIGQWIVGGTWLKVVREQETMWVHKHLKLDTDYWTQDVRRFGNRWWTPKEARSTKGSK